MSTTEHDSMLPLFKRAHVGSRAIEEFVKFGDSSCYSDNPNKRNALRQCSTMYRVVNGELYRHGREREYGKYGLRVVVHDDEPEKKQEIITKCHLDQQQQHLGINNTIKNINQLYYWQGVSAHVKMFVKKCLQCKTRSRLELDEWIDEERKNLNKKKEKGPDPQVSEARKEIKQLGKVKKPAPPETYFIVNARQNVDPMSLNDLPEMLIDSNNIEYVVETLGSADVDSDLKEVCHVMNVPDICPMPERFRSREIENFLKYGSYPDDFSQSQKVGLRGPASQHCIIDDELHHEQSKSGVKGIRLVIHDDTPALKVKVMVESHLDEDGTHLGLNRTMAKIGEKYFWMGMSIDVRKFMMKCKICSAPRGKRLVEDRNKFSEEVDRLKERQSQFLVKEVPADEVIEEHGEGATGYDDALQVVEGEDQQIQAIGEDTYNQVIRLLGPNQENITEITVEVVNGDYVATETVSSHARIKNVKVEEHEGVLEINEDPEQPMVDLRHPMVTEEDENIAAEALIEAGDILHYKSGLTDQVVQGDVESEYAEATSVDDAIAMMVHDEMKGESIEIQPLDQEESDEPKQMKGGDGDNTDQVSAENESDLQLVTTKDSGIFVPTNQEETGDMTNEAIHDGGTELVIAVEGSVQENSIEGNNAVNYTVYANSGNKMVATEADVEPDNVSLDPNITTTSAINYFKDVVYVPKSLKTRAIEDYLNERKITPGYTRFRLQQLSVQFYVEDLVLCRRASKYKGRQIVVHDDCPELKYKIIEEFHQKTNKPWHNSEIVTTNVIAYKYFWEEMRWDIHRYFLQCTHCVRDGTLVRTKKEVVPLTEQQQTIKHKRKIITESGLGRQRNQELKARTRNRLAEKVERKMEQESEAAVSLNPEQMLDIEEALEMSVVQLDGTTVVAIDEQGDTTVMADLSTVEEEMTLDDSDIEINIPESDTDTSPLKPRAPARTVIPTSDDFRIAVYATLDQEKVVRNMFEQRGWEYQLENMIRSPDIKARHSDGGDKDVYLMTLIVTLEIEQAIQQIFMENGWEYSLEVLAEPEREMKRSRGRPRKSVDVSQDHIVEEDVGKLRKGRPRKPEDNIEAEYTEMEVDELEGDEDKNLSKYLNRNVADVVYVSPVKETKGKKREISDVATPATEERRSRREIKKPRRFSPDFMYDIPIKTEKLDQDDLEEKSTTVKKEQVENIETNIIGRPKRSILKGKITTESPDKNAKKVDMKDTPGTVTVTKVSVPTSKAASVIKVSVPVSNPKIRSTEPPSQTVDVNKVKQDIPSVAIAISDEEDLDDDEDDYDDDFSDDDDGHIGASPALKVLQDAAVEETMTVVNAGDKFLCSLCAAIFPTKDLCQAHGLKNDCYNECLNCGKQFKKILKADYQAHLCMHENEVNFQCKSCTKVFYNAQHLKIHERVHNNEVMEVCSLCQEEFYTSFQYAVHMLHKHKDSKMFTCDVCRAKFANISFMKSELKIDGQLSYFKCVMCKK